MEISFGVSMGAQLPGGAPGGDEGEQVQLTVPLSSGEQQGPGLSGSCWYTQEKPWCLCVPPGGRIGSRGRDKLEPRDAGALCWLLGPDLETGLYKGFPNRISQDPKFTPVRRALSDSQVNFHCKNKCTTSWRGTWSQTHSPVYHLTPEIIRIHWAAAVVFPRGEGCREGWNFAAELDVTYWACGIFTGWLHLRDVSRNEPAAA